MHNRIMGISLVLVLCFAGPPVAAQDIHEAVQDGDMDSVKTLLLNHPERLNAENESGRTPLHLAFLRGHLEIVEFLMAKGARVDTRTHANYTSLHFAVHSLAGPEDKKKMVELLLAKDPGLVTRVNDHGIAPLTWAGGDLEETIALLLENGASINAKDNNGYTALHAWTRWWQEDKSAFLVQKGANVNARDNRGRTPLHLAAIVGRLDRATFLLNHGAELNASDHEGHTPLDYAKKFTHHALARYLVGKGSTANKEEESTEHNNLLAAPLGEKEAAIWYLDKNSWAVKTTNHLLVFDYRDWGIWPAEPSLTNGRINPGEIADQHVTVFVSNPDGYQQDIAEWSQDIADISYVFGFESEEIPDGTIMFPGLKKHINGLDITFLRSIGGGAGFLVQADDLVILHTGFLVRSDDSLGDFLQEEGDHLEDLTIDLAFLPVSPSNVRKENALDEFVSAAESLNPRIVFPSGGTGTAKFLYGCVARKVEEKKLKTEILTVDNRGDRFLWEMDK